VRVPAYHCQQVAHQPETEEVWSASAPGRKKKKVVGWVRVHHSPRLLGVVQVHAVLGQLGHGRRNDLHGALDNGCVARGMSGM
jgi:hypothetical protein